MSNDRPDELTNVPAAEAPRTLREFLDDGASRVVVTVQRGGRCTVRAEYGQGAAE